jgi:hypothetical protein
MWLQKHYPKTLWCRYADDGLVHCRSEGQAQHMLDVLRQRFTENGWIGYYGRYSRSALYAMCRHVNKALVRWARRKYKPLRRHKVKAIQFLEGIAKQSPHLFAHWRAGMIGGFA